jgi:hypothetical protein
VAVINPVGYLHNLTTHTAQTDRLSSAAGLLLPDAVGSLRPVGGLRHPADMALSAPGGMIVRVGAGMVYVPQGQSSLGGGYELSNDGNLDLTINTAHATLTRWDLIVARVQDSFYAGTNNLGDIIVIPGTASSTPSDPALPAGASYVTLGRVVVGPGVVAITAPNITQLAVTATLNGGTLRVTSTTRPPAAIRYDGLEIYETDTKRTWRWDAAINDYHFIAGPPQILLPTLNASLYAFISGASSLASGAFRRRGFDMEGFGAITNSVAYSAAVGSTYELGSIPAGTSPAKDEYFPVALATGSAFSTALMIIRANGTFAYTPQAAVGSGFSLFFSGARWRIGA